MSALRWLHFRRDSIVSLICAAGLVLGTAYCAVYDDMWSGFIILAQIGGW